MSDAPEIVASHGKSIVMRVPGRRFPGVWIPADSLSIWLDSLEEAEASGLAVAVTEVAVEIRAILGAYSKDLLSRGEALPYAWPRPTTQDGRGCEGS